jgi:hypothetical protein
LSRMQASASQFDMYSLFTRIAALQLAGALGLRRTREGRRARARSPGAVGLVSVIDQFVLLMLQLFAFSIPFASVKVLSKAHSQSNSFKAAYSAIMQLLLVLGSIGAGVGMVTFVVSPGWVSTSLADHTALVGIGLLAIPATILHAFFRNVPAARACAGDQNGEEGAWNVPKDTFRRIDITGLEKICINVGALVRPRKILRTGLICSTLYSKYRSYPPR